MIHGTLMIQKLVLPFETQGHVGNTKESLRMEDILGDLGCGCSWIGNRLVSKVGFFSHNVLDILNAEDSLV